MSHLNQQDSLALILVYNWASPFSALGLSLFSSLQVIGLLMVVPAVAVQTSVFGWYAKFVANLDLGCYSLGAEGSNVCRVEVTP